MWHSTVLTPDIRTQIKRCFSFHKWTWDTVTKTAKVHDALATLCESIIENVPDNHYRLQALNALAKIKIDCEMAMNQISEKLQISEEFRK